MNMLSLSVGIPTFNQATFLEATLESLLHQTRPPDEIVVSDHHSTDDTREVLARYAGRIRCVQPPPNTNLTGQYNFTLKSMTGDWITLLSSDDVARPNFCEALLRGAASRADAVLVRAGWEQIDAEARTLTSNYILSVPRIETSPASLQSQQHGPKVSFAAFAIKRQAFLDSGPILESMESLSDWALFLQMTPFGSYVYEHALLSGYRVGHDGNKFRDRLPPWIRDQQRVFSNVIPLAAERCGMTDVSWIGDASRYNYSRYLARASREFVPDDRKSTVALFQTWADTLSPYPTDPAQIALRAFAAGKVTQTSIPLTRRAKTALRPVFQTFHSFLRRS